MHQRSQASSRHGCWSSLSASFLPLLLLLLLIGSSTATPGPPLGVRFSLHQFTLLPGSSIRDEEATHFQVLRFRGECSAFRPRTAGRPQITPSSLLCPSLPEVLSLLDASPDTWDLETVLSGALLLAWPRHSNQTSFSGFLQTALGGSQEQGKEECQAFTLLWIQTPHIRKDSPLSRTTDSSPLLEALNSGEGRWKASDVHPILPSGAAEVLRDMQRLSAVETDRDLRTQRDQFAEILLAELRWLAETDPRVREGRRPFNPSLDASPGQAPPRQTIQSKALQAARQLAEDLSAEPPGLPAEETSAADASPTRGSEEDTEWSPEDRRKKFVDEWLLNHTEASLRDSDLSNRLSGEALARQMDESLEQAAAVFFETNHRLAVVLHSNLEMSASSLYSSLYSSALSLSLICVW